MSLTDQYRPASLADMIGNAGNRRILAGWLRKPTPTAWLFTGKPGIGKTSAALALASDLGCDPGDVEHISATTGVSDFRVLWDRFRTGSMWNPGGWKALVVDEADTLTTRAQAEWLLWLERIPKRGVIVFTSNESDFEPRFVSRCKHLRWTTEGVAKPGAGLLLSIAEAEGIALDERRAIAIVREEKNNLRAAVQRLELLGLAAA